MLRTCQIVPALAPAVHGAIEELPRMPKYSSPNTNRTLSTSSTSSMISQLLINNDSHSSGNYRSRSLTTCSRTIPQLDMRKAFGYFDKNHDGKLSIKEFKSVMRDLGYKTVDKRSIKQMFAEANRNGNKNTLSYDDFVEFLESKLLAPTDTAGEQITTLPTTTTSRSSSFEATNSVSLPKMQLDVETLFNCYDLDKNGYIEPKELRKVMKRLTGEKLSKQDIEEMINVADKNGDGVLDKSEFIILCKNFYEKNSFN